MPEVKVLSPEDEIIALRARLKLADDLAMAAHRVLKDWFSRSDDISLAYIDALDTAYKQLDDTYKRYLGKVEL